MYHDNRFKTQKSIQLHPNQYDFPKFNSFSTNKQSLNFDIFDTLFVVFTDLISKKKIISSIFSSLKIQNRESSIERNNKIIESRNRSPSIKQNFSFLKFRSINSVSLATSGFHFKEQQIMEEQVSFQSQYCLQKDQLKLLFEKDDDLIIIMAVGLMCRYLYLNNKSLNEYNLLKLFCVSAILSYKISYDSDLPGILSEFSQKFNLSIKYIINLQKQFLRCINYDVNLNGKTLHYLMNWFASPY